MNVCAPSLHQLDWRTSTGVGLQHIQPSSQLYQSEKVFVPKTLLEKNHRLQGASYNTSTGVNHCYKYYIPDRESAGKFQNNQSLDFQRPLVEKLRRSNFMPIPSGRTEYNQQFVRKDKVSRPVFGKVKPPNPHAICKSVYLGREEQKPVPLALSSVQKLLDPYVSTTHMDHRPFTERELNNPVNRKNIVTFYDFHEEPKVRGFGPRDGCYTGPDISVRREPIYDTAIFKTECTSRNLPKKTFPVPNKGLQTETQARYQPAQGSMSQYQWNTGVTFPRPSEWDPCPLPEMYSTEYQHIETGRPVRAVVDPGWPMTATIDPGVRQ